MVPIKDPPYRFGVPGHQKGRWITCVAKALSHLLHTTASRKHKCSPYSSNLFQGCGPRAPYYEENLKKQTKTIRTPSNAHLVPPQRWHKFLSSTVSMHTASYTGTKSWGEVTNTKYRINYLFCYLWKYKKWGSCLSSFTLPGAITSTVMCSSLHL